MDPDPRTVRRVSVDPPTPDPEDCVPPGERVAATVDLSDGWLAVTDRQVLAHRGDRDPPLVTVPRPNVAGVALRRAGDGPVMRYAPRIAVYGLLVLGMGLLFGALVPATAVEVPQDSPAAGSLGFVSALTSGLELLGDLAVLVGALALVGGAGAFGYRLLAGSRFVVVERADGSVVRCDADGRGAKRAIRELEAALCEPPGTAPGDEAPADTGAAGRAEARTDDAEAPPGSPNPGSHTPGETAPPDRGAGSDGGP
jgi:hypothetical protein